MQWNRYLHILGVALALGGYTAWVMPELGSPASPIPSGEIPLLDGAQARDLWARQSTVFVDVRSEADYHYGHIQGAISIPFEEFDQRLAWYWRRMQDAQAVVVYCKSLDCGKSLWAALRLRKEGLTKTHIYPPGWNEWYDRGYPITRTAKR